MVSVSIMPMKNSMNADVAQMMSKEFAKGNAVWKTVKSAETKIMR